MKRKERSQETVKQLSASLSPLAAAVQAHRAGQFELAERLYREVLAGDPGHFDALHMLGVIAAQQGRFAEAVDGLTRAAQVRPDDAQVHHNLGNALQSLGRLDEALERYDRALALRPRYPEALNARGNIHRARSQWSEALACYEAAAALAPPNATDLGQRARVLRKLERHEEALTLWSAALALAPRSAEITYNRANTLLTLGRHEEAAAGFRAAISLRPESEETWNNLGSACSRMKQHEEALAAFDRAIALRPDYGDAWFNRGNALHGLRRNDEALASYQRALVLNPDFPDAHNGLGVALNTLKRRDEAIECFQRALALRPDYPEALHNLGDTLMLAKRFVEAAAAYDRALQLDPDHAFAAGAAYDCLHHVCDWREHDARRQALLDGVRAGRRVCSPFVFLSLSDAPADQLRCASVFTEERHPPVEPPLWQGERYTHPRIRVAYLSADFYDHATAYLMAELFELHDREQFEWHAFAFGPERSGPMRARLERAFEHFHDVTDASDQDIARQIHALEIDIAVDLKGYTLHCRPGILARRPAPVQVSYIGYPGTLGAPYIDYVIGDPVVTPPAHDADYRERVVRLPECYQVNDRRRPIAATAPSRESLGLPPDAFVFCCFNNNYKITPDLFDVWMRLLRAVPGSVLWLLEDNPAVVPNLRREAQARGVEPDRLVFARRMELSQHLARHRCADLFLDTLPYNAHTTTSDALWAGLPVLTCLGTAFPGRVAASLLGAIELPELITHSLAEYEARALHLATHAPERAALRAKIERNRLSTPLFDAERFRLHLEDAFRAMHSRAGQGLPPACFDVAPRPRTMPAQAGPARQALPAAPIVRPAAAAVPVPADPPPDDRARAQVLFREGTALLKKGQFAAALERLDEAARLRPDDPYTHSNRGAALLHQQQYSAAREACARATELAPEFADGWNNLGSALMEMNRHAEALPHFERACALKPEMADFHNNRGVALTALHRHGQAAQAYARVRELSPNYRGIHSSEIFAMRCACIWPRPGEAAARTIDEFVAQAGQGQQPFAPFVLLAVSDDPALHQRVARVYTQHRYPPAPNPLWRGESYRHERIRVAYLSADFHNHATAYLMAELFELHDRSRFEWWGVSFGPSAQDAMRTRLQQAFDHFLDVRDQPDEAIARMLRGLEIDIAVDLKGYTRDCRPGILAHRPAPIQVNYLGFPGTMGSPCIDVLIGDPVVTPPEHDRFYDEKVIRLPHCYQVNDRQRPIAEQTPSRAALGLPENAFVFCCFNNNYKITPELFDIWMRLLHAVPGSVLWLLESNPESASNLASEAARRGVEPSRIVFAPKLPLAEHLARHRCADLFLDTLPYNAHTTTSDALWAGLPVLTCLGTAFPGRVAASLLGAIELPELITHSLAEYEARALHLATHAPERAALRAKIERNRLSTPLFDAERFRLHLEDAFRAMHSRAGQGLPPACFDVAPRPRTMPAQAGPARQALPAAPIVRPAAAAVPVPADPPPDDRARAQVLFREGTALLKKGQFAAALERLDEAARLRPDDPYTHSNRGAALLHQQQYSAAREACARATELAPEFADGWNNLGSALMEMNRHAEALPHFERACALKPEMADFHNNRGVALTALHRHGQAAQAYARVRELSPNYRGIHSSEIFAMRCACIWPRPGEAAARTIDEFVAQAGQGQQPFAPFVLLAVSDDPALHQRVARVYTQHRYPPAPNPLWRGESYRHERIRVAYLSADFHNHATAYLMAELFELHDRSRFEWWGVSFGPSAQDAMRTRLQQAFDHFLDVRDQPDEAIARMLRGLEIDIAVDLKGYTRDCRPGILAHRPAPIQVNYLGFPGTMGSPCIDVLIGDPVVTPPEHDRFYDEKVIRLPHCYQVNDRQRPIAEQTPSRAALGLPENAFVFCCFNNNYKITPELFDIWMRLLHAVPGSVLWLLESNPESASNLASEAARRGVEATRIVFAPKLPLAEHLARHRCADLFLDTLPYNAHTTTSDALWAGLPVLTCLGKAFPGRVAASLLTAIGMPELITHSLAEYEALALHLATHPDQLARLRLRLATQRLTTPLFDSEGFRRDIEAAYLHLAQRQVGHGEEQ